MQLLRRVFRWKLKFNQINVIKIYRWNGLWVFDDAAVGIDKEALVAGIPEMIRYATAQFGILNPEQGFLALFSKDPFPGHQLCLEWARQEDCGNVYHWPEAGIEGWLCPALFSYFDKVPLKMYVQLRSCEVNE